MRMPADVTDAAYMIAHNHPGGVRVLATFPASSHAPIVYPVARIKASTNPQAAAFVRWLGSKQAAAIFRKHGFRVH